ncbi:Peptidoglycan/LPS O-acetylase OafA/YrhL, contains acyltransferase and SGNH-hydrolase domains [Pseudobutyrivibrio ruminis]|uniref:Peptidoglycan/LPS O-acetylase OafA/YrhL, contains acyltransferase and SGNH-hydrolase domains n=1 Tax=Pseudobutyrivibrio ruminis TaxID=46206 RepID=A0A1H7H692_9FIRM|nr:acyltransferase [Pseudobutyrivibrio ruminis]SEK45811.1 Peptidoglycan/LPS O-acetylase OafA/YrhL, contains acyltransferase and SGNH-hydrolase domains [Pseudobutyrivibrio ruminis]
MGRKYRCELDIIKGISIIMVIITHYNRGGLLNDRWEYLFSLGARGCQIFFVISAYLTAKGIKNKFPEGLSFYAYKQWIKSKIIRLWPLYCIALVSQLIVIGRQGNYRSGEQIINNSNIIAHFLLLHDVFPGWCNSILSIEWYIGVLFLFYLIAPFLLLNIAEKRKVVLLFCYVFTISAVVSWALSYFVGTDDYVTYTYINNFSLLGQAIPLMSGVLYANVEDLLSSVIEKTDAMILLIFLMGIIFLYRDLPTFMSFALWSMVACLLLIAFNNSKYNRYRIIRLIGRNSYGIYLFHLYMIKMVLELNRNYDGPIIVKWLGGLAMIVALSLVVSIILETIVKKTILILKTKILNRYIM